ILVQMPVFIGIFYVIRKFGGQPGYSEPLYPSFTEGGLFWFQDLSHMDPYFVLPVVSALTMLAATEITAKNIDPQQRWIMRLLPIGVTIFLWRFPAGLFVYWITSNLVTLVQNYLIYNHGPGKKPAVDSGKKAASAQQSATSDASRLAASQNGADDPEASQLDDAESRAAKVAKRKRRKKKK
ncbi:MAG: membrane protein insertase YidC, partial [Rubrobacter sp.]|nr:membrane protein insertase YidC [Rubrobacter sp.]